MFSHILLEEIMFTKPQLELLIEAQSGDDWSPYYFPQRLVEISANSNVSSSEINELTNLVKSYSTEQIRSLQMALMYLEDL